MNTKNPMLMTVVVAIVVGALSFFGGMKYAQSQRGNFARNGAAGGNFMMQGGGQRAGGGTGAQGGQRGGAGFRPVIGEIISADDKSITVKLDDGSSKIVLISDTTPINKAASGTKSDLTVGTKVGVFGQENNGTITAQNIQLNPQMRGGAQGSPSASPK